jgi:thymidine phosphorylase
MSRAAARLVRQARAHLRRAAYERRDLTDAERQLVADLLDRAEEQKSLDETNARASEMLDGGLSWEHTMNSSSASPGQRPR